MSNKCIDCSTDNEIGWERVRYFPRQLITAEDMTQEQRYFRDKLRRHGRILHSWGVVCGLDINPDKDEDGNPIPYRITIEPGYAISPYGDEIIVDRKLSINLNKAYLDDSVKGSCKDMIDPWCSDVNIENEPNALFYLAIKYAECYSRPVRVLSSGCSCDETKCEYSRIRDSFAIKMLSDIPQSHKIQPQDVEYPPECPTCPSEPWVVLAKITIDQQGKVVIDNQCCRRIVFALGDFLTVRCLTIRRDNYNMDHWPRLACNRFNHLDITGRDDFRLNIYHNIDAKTSRSWIELWGNDDPQRVGELTLAGTFIDFRYNSIPGGYGNVGMRLASNGNLSIGNTPAKYPQNKMQIENGDIAIIDNHHRSGKIRLWQENSNEDSYVSHAIGTEYFHNTYGAGSKYPNSIGHKFFCGGIDGLIAQIGFGGAGKPKDRLDSSFYGKVSIDSELIVDNKNGNKGSLSPGIIFGNGSGEGISSNRKPTGVNPKGLSFYTNSQHRLSIRNDGNVGINTNNPIYTLETNGLTWSVAHIGINSDYAEYFESIDGEKIPAGTSVVLMGDKIRPAKKDEEPIGVISSNPVIAGGLPVEWPKKYLRDDFGNLIMEEYKEEIMVPEKRKIRRERQKMSKREIIEEVIHSVIVQENGKYCQKEIAEEIKTEIEEPVFEEHDLYDESGENVIGKHLVPVIERYYEEIEVLDENDQPVLVGSGKFITKQRPRLNPEYDPKKEYIPRDKRSEWNCVGLLGQIPLRKGQPVAESWIKLKDISDKTELWLIR